MPGVTNPVDPGSGVSSAFSTTTAGLLNVGPGSSPPTLPDPSQGNIAGVWGFVGEKANAPSQTSSPPTTCGVFGQAGVAGDGITGTTGQNFTGVAGTSDSGTGVAGTSDSGTGVAGTSRSGTGVYGTGACGVVGVTTSTSIDVLDAGVQGSSNGAAAGILAQTNGTGPALLAIGKGNQVDALGIPKNPGLAAFFAGDVIFTGELSAGGANRLALSGASFSAPIAGTDAAFSGTVTSSDVVLSGADCAEEFDIAGTEIEPGTVAVLDDNGALEVCIKAYDKRVCGVISGAGEFRPGMILDRRQTTRRRAAIALAGKVYCKVDASHSPIEIGDLLTSSATPGHAMKAGDQARAFGAVIGKAMGVLGSGRGIIPILVALQ